MRTLKRRHILFSPVRRTTWLLRLFFLSHYHTRGIDYFPGLISVASLIQKLVRGIETCTVSPWWIFFFNSGNPKIKKNQPYLNGFCCQKQSCGSGFKLGPYGIQQIFGLQKVTVLITCQNFLFAPLNFCKFSKKNCTKITQNFFKP